MTLEFNQQVDKKAIFLLFGCYCLRPKNILSDKYITTEYDYPEKFHKMIWGSLVNIAKKGNVEKITSLDVQNEVLQFEPAAKMWKENNGWEYIDDAIEMAKDRLENIGEYHDNVRKYSILRNMSEYLKMDISFLYDEKNEESLRRFSAMTSREVLLEIMNKFYTFKNMWNNPFEDSYSFKGGEGIKNLLAEHKNQVNVYGYPYQSGYMTTILRGMRRSKYVIRSSVSGGGKSRSSMAEACDISVDYIYDWSKRKWMYTGQKEPVLYISTELEKKQIQDCLLAHVSGIDQEDIIEWKNITPEKEEVLNKAAEYVEESLFYGEYLPDFNIDSISDTVEQYVNNYKIGYCFFDYINDSPSLYEYYYKKTKARLRTDQILYLFSESLKLMGNKFDIYIGSSTQLNDNYKDDANKDASALKGSKAIIEKADAGILSLPVTKKDLKRLKPILERTGSFGVEVPNTAYYVFKNRDGKWKNVIVWTKMNLGNVREKDCFVTDYNYELITDIDKTSVGFEMEDVGEVQDNSTSEKFENFSARELAEELS